MTERCCAEWAGEGRVGGGLGGQHEAPAPGVCSPDVHLPGVDLHDPGPGLLVGHRELNLSVQAAGAEQGRVQDVHPVGGCNYLNKESSSNLN